MGIEEDVQKSARKQAVRNAVEYNKAISGSVLAKVFAEVPESKTDVAGTRKIVAKVVDEVNSLQKAELEEELATYSFPEKKQREWLPELDWVKPGEAVNTRFAPNPSGYMHIGHAKPTILDDEYAKRYGGKFWLRFEDTDPKTKKPIVEFYKLIEEDVRWLGCKIAGSIRQSERIEIYYKYAEQLIKEQKAYVCTCEKEVMQKNRMEGKACPCRAKSSTDDWNKMLNGSFKEGEAILRLKTDLNHPNSSIRDWIMFRIIDEPHPLTGITYRVWPLYNFAAVIDDYEMDINLVIRGKEHELNALKQQFLYKALNWKEPHVMEIGVLKVHGGLEHKSAIRDAIQNGELSGWDDPRAPTLAGIRNKGIDPRAIRDYIISSGVGKNDSYLDWAKLESFNRKYKEKDSTD